MGVLESGQGLPGRLELVGQLIDRGGEAVDYKSPDQVHAEYLKLQLAA
jgi:hypothetical protein